MQRAKQAEKRKVKDSGLSGLNDVCLSVNFNQRIHFTENRFFVCLPHNTQLYSKMLFSPQPLCAINLKMALAFEEDIRRSEEHGFDVLFVLITFRRYNLSNFHLTSACVTKIYSSILLDINYDELSPNYEVNAKCFPFVGLNEKSLKFRLHERAPMSTTFSGKL